MTVAFHISWARPFLRIGIAHVGKSKMAFDFEWTFRAGDLLTFAGGVFVAGSILYKRGGRDAIMAETLRTLTLEVTDSKRETKESISSLQAEIKKIGDVLINQADQNRRIIHLEEDVRELRHGDGFIHSPRGIDKEYTP